MSVDDGPTLPELIRLVMERDGLSQAAICRRANERGFPHIIKPRISQLLKDPIMEYMKPETIEGLAAGLNVSYDDVMNAVTRSLGRPHIWRPGKDGPAVIVDHDITAEQAEVYGDKVRGMVRRGRSSPTRKTPNQ